jgi:hypothetical protein
MLDKVRSVTEIERACLQLQEDVAAGLSLEEIMRRQQRLDEWMNALEGELREREQVTMREKRLGDLIDSLEGRTNVVLSEARELESTDLQRQATKVREVAERLRHELQDLKARVMTERIDQLPRLGEKAEALKGQVESVEASYQELLRQIDAKEQAAREVDKIDRLNRHAYLQLVAGEYMFKRGLDECEFVGRRGMILERARKMLDQIPVDARALIQHGADAATAEHIVAQANALKEQLRTRAQDVHHLVSEGLGDTSIGKKERALPYSMKAAWQSGDKPEFYRRLWALHYLTSSKNNLPSEIKDKVKALISYVNQYTSPDQTNEKIWAAEARQFLLMAGNGVIRRVLEQRYAGLQTEDDYARLGRDLRRPRGQNSYLKMLQLAVNIPRLYDLGLSDRFRTLYETRTQKRRVSHITDRPESGIAQDFDDLEDIPPEELTGDWIRRLLDGDLPMVTNLEHTEARVEVGHEKTTEAQIYILDHSGSMVSYGSGMRWFLRDAILIAALNTFSTDANAKGSKEFDNALMWRLFGSTLTELRGANNEREALQWAHHLLNLDPSHEPLGGTELEYALATGYYDIETAKQTDPRLAKATVVMVTDGAVERRLNLHDLLKRQNINGTRVVTHVFAIEQENAELRELSRLSGGRASYNYIDDARDGSLLNITTGHNINEYSPTWNEPQFGSAAEQAEFEARVEEMSREINDLFTRRRQDKEKKERSFTKELSQLMAWSEKKPRAPFYEDKAKTPAAQDQARRKLERMDEIISCLWYSCDDQMTSAEVMGLWRNLAEVRAVLPRDIKAIVRTTNWEFLRKQMNSFREKKYAELKDIRK